MRHPIQKYVVKVALVVISFSTFLIADLSAADFIKIELEDFNDRNFANNLSGEMVTWSDGEKGSVDVSFDAENVPPGEGSCLKMAYSLTDGGFAGITLSLRGKMDRKDLVMNFKDVYGDLKNSRGNPGDVEHANITGCRFRAKGNGGGEFDHTVKLELEDRFGNRIYKRFNIPNTGRWQAYEFAIEDAGIVHLDAMKSIAFGLSDYLNDNRASHFFIDDIVLETDAPTADATDWSDDAFLDLISHRAFHYFLTFTAPQGFAIERSSFSDLVSIDAIGYQLAAYCIGHHRGWADAELLEGRIETILTNLNALPQGGDPGTGYSGYKGFFYTFLNADTGKRKDANSQITLYSNTLLMFGVLTAKAYFPDNPTIQTMAGKLYDAVEWDWMVAGAADEHPYKFRLAWTPEAGFSGYVDGYTDESLLTNILALGSPTHPTTMETYHAIGRVSGKYPDNADPVDAVAWTGALNAYLLSSCWLDVEKGGLDRHNQTPVNVWENNKAAVIANHQFCIDHQDDVPADGDDHYMTYGENAWGLTACQNPLPVDNGTIMSESYYAFGALPAQQHIQNPDIPAPHVGTLAIYGAGGAVNYLPTESIAALRHYYAIPKVWNPVFGFSDAFSLDPHYYESVDGRLDAYPIPELNGPWVNAIPLSIDVGVMLLAIDNYRSGLVRSLSFRDANIVKGWNSAFTHSVKSVSLPPRLTLNEADTEGQLTIQLTAPPADDVTVDLTVSAPHVCGISQSMVTLNETNWSDGVSVTVENIAGDDDLASEDRHCTIETASAVSEDPTFDGIDPIDVSVTILDDDVFSVAVSPTELTVNEPDGVDDFILMLTSQPRANVTVSMSVSNPGECRISPSSVVFSDADWNENKTVTVTAVDDGLPDGVKTCTVFLWPTASEDETSDGVDPPDVTVTVVDDNPPILLEHVSPSVGIVGEQLAVTLTGVGFYPNTAVFIKSGDVSDYSEAIEGIVVDSENKISAILHAQATAGQYDIKVQNDFGDHEIKGAVSFQEPQALDELKGKKAIIVAGSGPYDGNVLWNATLTCSTMAYYALSSQGYSDENIYFLSSDPFIDVDGDGNSDVDADATNETLEYAIKSWTREGENSTDELILYMTGHGNEAFFEMGRDQGLHADDLYEWLADLRSMTDGRIIVIYDACMSGSFLDPLKMLADSVIITSTEADERAWFVSDGRLSFSYFFWENVYAEGRLYNAFQKAGLLVGLDQTPLVDLDGDGQANIVGPEQIGNDIVIGRGRVAASLPPAIGFVSEDVELACERTSEFRCGDITASNGVSQVWACILSPQSADSVAAEPILYPPIVRLTDEDGDGRYAARYDDFTQNGGYRISIYARDKSGYESIPVQTQVNRSCRGDMDGDGGVTLKDVVAVLKVLAGMETDVTIVSDYSESGQDVNGDGAAGLAEAIYVLHYVANQ